MLRVTQPAVATRIWTEFSLPTKCYSVLSAPWRVLIAYTWPIIGSYDNALCIFWAPDTWDWNNAEQPLALWSWSCLNIHFVHCSLGGHAERFINRSINSSRSLKCPCEEWCISLGHKNCTWTSLLSQSPDSEGSSKRSDVTETCKWRSYKKKKKMTQPSKELTNIIFGKFEDSRGLYYTPVSWWIVSCKDQIFKRPQSLSSQTFRFRDAAAEILRF